MRRRSGAGGDGAIVGIGVAACAVCCAGPIAGVFAAAFMGGRTLQVVFAAVLTLIGLQMLLTARWRLRQQRLAQPLTVSEPA